MMLAKNQSQSQTKETKRVAFNKLKEEIRQAAPVQKRLVFGEGDVNAKLVIIGEAPGRKEEILGRPFVGPAGHLLDQLLVELALKRADIWITNLVKWRPTQNSDQTRTPLRSEVKSNTPWLKRELNIINPAVILCLGNVAASALINRTFRMNEEHGRWYKSFTGAATIATFHPAYVLRQGRKTREQMLNLMRNDLRKMKLQYMQL